MGQVSSLLLVVIRITAFFVLGTKVGDPEEIQAVEEVFLKGRTTPLLIGSVKSNIGHTEPSSGLCSITKVIVMNLNNKHA